MNWTLLGKRFAFICVQLFGCAYAITSLQCKHLQAESIILRALPAGQFPDDARLGKLQHYRHGHFPFKTPKNLEDWVTRSANLKRRVAVATGLWPMPQRAKPRAVVHSLVDREEYTVECVYLESYPGHYVTGNLYRPKNTDGPVPAILSPYGHWPGGRFQERSLKNTLRDIKSGAERHEIGGRYPIQARCVQLARMGCIVFNYDMEGYADSQQISEDIAHRTRSRRPEFDGKENWGFFSTQAELRMISPMGLQTFNGICALDWIASLPEVDQSRMGITGGSGGATQCLMLGALDDRIAVSFPVVMVSTEMQGGCPCENACCLRVHGGNVDLAALFAPKPLGMASANDWTHNFINDGYPEMEQLYDLYDAKENVSLASLTQFSHNYNYASRSYMYKWFNTHFNLGHDSPIVEEDFIPLSQEELSVWNPEHPQPDTDENYERELVGQMSKAAEQAISAFAPLDASSQEVFHKIVGGAFKTLVGYELPKHREVKFVVSKEIELDGYQVKIGLTRCKKAGSELPTSVIFPTKWNGEFILWVNGEGKSSLFSGRNEFTEEIQLLLDNNYAVVSSDLLYQGEFLEESTISPKNRKAEEQRDLAAFTYGYNLPIFSHRTGDLLSMISLLRHWEDSHHLVHMIGLEGAAPCALAARALAGGEVKSALVDTEQFRFQELTSWIDVNFLPGAVKYGDLPGLIALSAPHILYVTGEANELPTLALQAYSATAKPDALVKVPDEQSLSQLELLKYFLSSIRKSDFKTE